MDTIGERLEYFAKVKFGSKTAMAKALGILPQSLTAYYQNKTKPGLALQTKLRAIGCDVEWLITGKEPYQRSVESNVTDFVKLLEDKDTLIYRLTNEVKLLREEVDEYRQKIAPLPR